MLGAVWQGETSVYRAFFATGTDPADFEAVAATVTPDAGDRAIREVRGVSGGFMLVGHDAAASPRVQLGSDTVTLEPADDECAQFARRNVLFATRLKEPADRVADWLHYHATHHGAGAALIIDRAPTHANGSEDGFAKALQKALASRLAPDFVVVVMSPGIPLGKPDSPGEDQPWLAPDAPGKDRMARPPDDPWLAPLGQELVLELAKWWFLAKARAVLCVDVCDLLSPRAKGAPSAFDLCLLAKRGVVPLLGTHVYPWRLRDDAAPQFGDHICRLAGHDHDLLRWGVAPEIAGLDKTWRLTRVSYAKPDPDHAVPFWRAMGLRVPSAGGAALAPKAGLAEDPALLATATGIFGHKPVRMPVAKARATTSPRTCIVTTMKNEGPFILEWLAWHRAIGVNDVLVYTNDCTDGTDTLLSLLQDKGLVQHRANPWKPGGALKPQHAALQAAESEPIVQDAGWVVCMDVDEFINIKLGDGRLPTLYAAMETALPGANMISMTWRLFGNADVQEYRDAFVTDQFSLCAQELIRKPHQAWGFKTLFRNLEVYKKIGVHRPKGLTPSLREAVKWLNGSGRPMPAKMLRNGWRSSLDTYGYDWVQLNHYAVRSAESFLVKRDRGRVNHTERDQGLAYWFRMNHNAVEDRSIQARLPLLQTEWDRLMADPDIRAAHDRSVAAHLAKIADLRADPAHADFYADLTGPRLQSLSRRLKHFGTAVFAAGPAVVPDEIALAPHLPDTFFFTVKGPADDAADARPDADRPTGTAG